MYDFKLLYLCSFYSVHPRAYRVQYKFLPHKEALVTFQHFNTMHLIPYILPHFF